MCNAAAGSWSRSLLFLGLSTCCALGCGSGPPAVRTPGFNPSAMASRALADYDKNRDGKLDGAELKECPALLGSLSEIDKDKDGCLNADEIAERLKLYQSSGIGIMSVACRVNRGGQAVGGVVIKLVPEAFMNDAIKPAEGESGPDGFAGLNVPGESAPGVHLGFYRIEASLKNNGGRIETKAPLGQEISPTMRGEIVVRLPAE